MTVDPAQNLIECAANCAVYEADRLAGGPAGLPADLLKAAGFATPNLDRDWYGHDLAADLTAPGQAKALLERTRQLRVFPVFDPAHWARAFNLAPAEVVAHWETTNREIVEAIVSRAELLLERHNGNVPPAPDPFLAGMPSLLDVDLEQVLARIRTWMEHFDREVPDNFAAEDAMTPDELAQIFAARDKGGLELGVEVITETARNAREILAPRWPRELVEAGISAEARLQMFLGDMITISERPQGIARVILNRALASPAPVTHPELDGLDLADLSSIWLALIFWYAIKSGSLNQHARPVS